MPEDEDDDLYDEEFDFVDDDETPVEDSELTEEDSVRDREANERDDAPESPDEADVPVDEYGRPEQTPANYVVHVYEHKKFKRTIERPFTPEDAEAFATEFNRTSKNYGRIAVTSKNDAKPKKALD